MHRALIRVFLEEIALQCWFISTASDRLSAALAKGDEDEAWLQIQMILTSAANVSKILWGSGGNREAERKKLRDAVAAQADSPLRNPALRNDFEHFDERVEHWWSKYGPPRIYIGRHITSYRVLPEFSYKRFQHFDPETGEVTFWDNSVSVPPVVAEAERILAKARRALSVVSPESKA